MYISIHVVIHIHSFVHMYLYVCRWLYMYDWLRDGFWLRRSHWPRSCPAHSTACTWAAQSSSIRRLAASLCDGCISQLCAVARVGADVAASKLYTYKQTPMTLHKPQKINVLPNIHTPTHNLPPTILQADTLQDDVYHRTC